MSAPTPPSPGLVQQVSIDTQNSVEIDDARDSIESSDRELPAIATTSNDGAEAPSASTIDANEDVVPMDIDNNGKYDESQQAVGTVNDDGFEMPSRHARRADRRQLTLPTTPTPNSGNRYSPLAHESATDTPFDWAESTGEDGLPELGELMADWRSNTSQPSPLPHMETSSSLEEEMSYIFGDRNSNEIMDTRMN